MPHPNGLFFKVSIVIIIDLSYIRVVVFLLSHLSSLVLFNLLSNTSLLLKSVIFVVQCLSEKNIDKFNINIKIGKIQKFFLILFEENIKRNSMEKNKLQNKLLKDC